MQAIKIIVNAVPCTFQVSKTGQLAPLGLTDPTLEVKIAIMGDKTGETGNLAPLGLADPSYEVKIAATDKTGILAPLGMADPAVKFQVSSRDAKALELTPVVSTKIGSQDVDSLGLTPVVSIKLGSQDLDSLDLADPAMTVKIGINNIDALGLANPSGTAVTDHVNSDIKSLVRRLLCEFAKAYEQDTPQESCYLCGGPKDFASVDRVVPGGGSYDYSKNHYRCMACPPTVNALTAHGDADDDDAVIDYVNGRSLN